MNDAIKFRFFIAMATQSLQADFTDVSVLPVIVQKLKEEKVEVGKLMLFQVNFSKIDYVIDV